MQNTVAILSQSKTKTDYLTSVESVDISDDNPTLFRSDAIAVQSREPNEQCLAENYNYLHSSFYEALSPLIICLKLSGLYFNKNTDRTVSLQQLYCYIVSFASFVALILVASLFRFVSSVDVDFMTILACFSFALLCAANAVSFLKHSHNSKHVRKFFRGFDNLNKYGGPFTQSVQINKMAKCAAIISCIVYVFGVGIISYAVYLTELFNVILGGFGLEPSSPIMKIIMTAFVCFLGFQWIFPNCVELCFGIHIYWEFTKFYESFRERMRSDRGQLKESIDIDRQRFVEMTRIVEAADTILSIHHGASFASNVVNLCLILYMVAYYSTVAQVSFIIAYSIFCIADIVVICISGILIKSAVRYKLDLLTVQKLKKNLGFIWSRASTMTLRISDDVGAIT